MLLTTAYSKIKKTRNLVLINNVTHQRETLSKRPIRLPLSIDLPLFNLVLSFGVSLCNIYSTELTKQEQNKIKQTKKQNKTKQKTEKSKLRPRYWNVPVLVYQYCLKIWYLCSLERASVIQKLTILGRKKWSSIVQYSCTSIWDLKYTFSQKTKKKKNNHPVNFPPIIPDRNT